MYKTDGSFSYKCNYRERNLQRLLPSSVIYTCAYNDRPLSLIGKLVAFPERWGTYIHTLISRWTPERLRSDQLLPKFDFNKFNMDPDNRTLYLLFCLRYIWVKMRAYVYDLRWKKAMSKCVTKRWNYTLM